MQTILVIDDDQAILSFLQIILKKNNYSVITAGNGLEGMEKVKDQGEDIQLVITDLIMPEADGMAVISWLKVNYTGIKVIAMSGGGRTGPESYLPLADMIGADATLQKPFDKKSLLDAIEKVLG